MNKEQFRALQTYTRRSDLLMRKGVHIWKENGVWYCIARPGVAQYKKQLARQFCYDMMEKESIL